MKSKNFKYAVLLAFFISTPFLRATEQPNPWRKFACYSWFATCAADIAIMLVKPLRYALFGGQEIPAHIKSMLKPIIKNIAGDKVVDFKQARGLWSILNGNIFSNHTTIFLSGKLCAKTLIDEQLIEKVTYETVRIKHNRDLKVITATLVIPFLVRYGIKGYNYSIDKLCQYCDVENTQTLRKLHIPHKKIGTIFTSEDLISLLSILAFIRYQDWMVSKETRALLNARNF